LLITDDSQLDCRQRLIEIGEDIVHVFNPNRDADHAVGDADFAAAFFADAACVIVRDARSESRLRPATRPAADAHLAQHLVGVRERSVSKAIIDRSRHLPFGQFVLRMIGNPG